jgi:S-DNA-T family DNA segregation ATPase FtsK/SpoIIIE
MERRYDILEAEQMQNIKAYHQQVYEPAKAKWKKQGAPAKERYELPEALPYIVTVIDEINDIMQVYPNEMESILVRLAQMSRAVGIHVILSTQRPSTNVITGSLKANIPTRIAFSVTSQVDSRTILDAGGAEKLLGGGDMLYLSSVSPRPIRLQGFNITETAVKQRVKDWIKRAQESAHLYTLDFSERAEEAGESFFKSINGDEEFDELYEEAKHVAIKHGKISTSLLQRTLRIGYSRSARLLDMLEEGGVIGPQDGSKPREVIIKE